MSGKNEKVIYAVPRLCPDRMPYVILTVGRKKAIAWASSRRYIIFGLASEVMDTLALCPYRNFSIMPSVGKKCDRNITVGARHQQMSGKNEKVIYAVPRLCPDRMPYVILTVSREKAIGRVWAGRYRYLI